VFKESYNALLIKVADMINENIKSFVGDSAGNKIVSVTQYIDAIEDGQNIIAILNQALDTVSSLKAAKLQDINVTSLFNLIDIFKQNTEIADGIFAETYNAILVYMINTVNGEVANYVGSELSTQIETYTGNINVTARYNYLREIVECGVNAFKAVPEGGSLEDISSETLSSFLDALNSTDYTRATYNALNNKLANVVIESINKLINVSNTVITEIKDLTAQADDVKNVTDIALDVVPLFENCSFKLDEMSTDQKQGAVNIMNALQTNTKKADSVFNESYNSLLEHIALANDISSDYIYENYATDGIIDWESLIMA